MEDGTDASALPYGITWSGVAFAGTVNASAPQGVYRPVVRVTDSANPANVKTFLCKMKVIA
jgi:hypothetical protein